MNGWTVQRTAERTVAAYRRACVRCQQVERESWFDLKSGATAHGSVPYCAMAISVGEVVGWRIPHIVIAINDLIYSLID